MFPRIALLSGGFGGARLVTALRESVAPGQLSVIANTGDDLTWYGLRICPDVDAILYSLAGMWNAEAGWGRRGEAFRTRDALTDLGSPPWFNVGDLDLAFHLLRTELLNSGKTLTEATSELARRLRVRGVTVIPASDQPQETHVVLQDGRLLHFQEWYVKEGAHPLVRQVRVPEGPASPAALETLRHADAVIIGPSNPVSSIGPILSRDGLSELVRQARGRIAVSPVVLGVRPSDAAVSHHARARQRLLAAGGAVDTPEGIARRYADLVQYYVLDQADSAQVPDVERLGLHPVTCDLLDPTELARTLTDLSLTVPSLRGHSAGKDPIADLIRAMLRVVLVTPLSGSLGGYGRAGADALALWASWHNDRFRPRIEMTVFDAHPDPVAALNRSSQVAPDLLFGPYGSGPTAAVAGATSRLVWNHGGAWVPAEGNLVTVLAPADTYFHGTIRAVRKADTGVRTLCILSSETGFSDAVAQGAVDEATRLGLRAISGRLPGGAHPADMLLVSGRFAAEVDAARRLLPGNWRAAGFVGAGVEEVLAGLGRGREGLLGPAQWLAEAASRPDDGPTAAEFVAAYRRRTGGEPPYPAAQAFAAGVIATRCLREAGTADDDALLAAACDIEVTTMFARFRLDPRTRRQVGHQVLTVQWQDGVRRVVWPPERAQAPLRYPLAVTRHGSADRRA